MTSSNYINLPNGIALVFTHGNYTDLFHFASIKYQQNDVRELMIHLEPIKKVSVFFIQETKEILKDTSNYSTLINANQIVGSLYERNINRYRSLLHTTKNAEIKKFIMECFPEQLSITSLTQAELNCLEWAVKGKTSKEISIILSNSLRTIENHLASIRNKLGCRNLIEAIKIANTVELF